MTKKESYIADLILEAALRGEHEITQTRPSSRDDAPDTIEVKYKDFYKFISVHDKGYGLYFINTYTTNPKLILDKIELMYRKRDEQVG